MKRIVAAFLVLSLTTTACGVEHLPPPAAPSRELPKDLEVPTEAPAPGHGRVILDTAGQRAKAVEITGAATAMSGGYAATIVGVRPLCTTPCVVDLAYGSHSVMFRAEGDPEHQSEAEVAVGTRPKVVRHALGERKTGGAAASVGAALLLTGLSVALTGAILWGVGGASKTGSSLEGTGQVLTGLGAAGFVLSIPFLIAGRPTERPGATTEWSLPAHGAPTPGGEGVQHTF